MKPIIFSMPGNESNASRLGELLGWQLGKLKIHRFPDGESNPQFLDSVEGRNVAIVCTLDRPDNKLVALYLTAMVARELGAARVGLIVPYLAYMRQDKRFRSGEGVTSLHVARLLSSTFDWLATVDPHLHRHHDLGEIYSIPTKAVHAAPAISAWISANITSPVLIGPDAESEQWVSEVAKDAECPYTVLTKIRHGDHDVEVSVPDAHRLRGMTPVLVDDIVSTARTMVAAARHIQGAELAPPVCIVVHALFADDAYKLLRDSGVARVVSCNTIAHPTNEIDLSKLMLSPLSELVATQSER